MGQLLVVSAPSERSFTLTAEHNELVGGYQHVWHGGISPCSYPGACSVGEYRQSGDNPRKLRQITCTDCT